MPQQRRPVELLPWHLGTKADQNAAAMEMLPTEVVLTTPGPLHLAEGRGVLCHGQSLIVM